MPHRGSSKKRTSASVSKHSSAKRQSDKKEEALFRRMQRGSDSINSKESAIRVAKSRGLVKQQGSELVLTEKGKKAASKAQSKS